jgi:hypothetical protein
MFTHGGLIQNDLNIWLILVQAKTAGVPSSLVPAFLNKSIEAPACECSPFEHRITTLKRPLNLHLSEVCLVQRVS